MGRSILTFLPFFSSNSGNNLSPAQSAFCHERLTSRDRVALRGTRIVLLSLPLLIVTTLLPDKLWATTITATSCSQADVGTAVASATNGDIVIIPPCSQTNWNTTLNVNVGITLQGSGQGVTIIGDNVPKDGTANSRLITFNVNSPNNFRITGFTLVGVATDPNVYNQGHIAIGGTSQAFRIDNITVNSPQTSVVRTFGYLWGLIDHITVNGNHAVLQAGHDGWGGFAYGDGSWAEQLYLGTQMAIYVEDCTLTANSNPYTTNFLDGMDGARVVFRHNTLTQGNTTSHGLDSSQRRRSIRSQEIYSNAFTFPASMAPDFTAWFRGGTGVMFSNTINAPGGLNNVAKHSNLRDTGSYTPWGQCDGTQPYDQNTAAQTGYLCVDQGGAGTSFNLNGVNPPPASQVGNISDPIYVWGNTVNGVANDCGNFGCGSDGHVVAGRDIIFGTARPGYTPYIYPHPLQSGTAAANPPPAPTNLSVR